MFVNVNEFSLPVTASSTPTAYALPDNATRVRVFNDSGATAVVKLETSSTATLTAPVAGTKFEGTAMPNQGVEMFDVSPEKTHITVYSASGTGTIYIQHTYGE